jgi:hypothetical protein
MELREPVVAMQRERRKRRPREADNTDARHRGRAARSSDDDSESEFERRGSVIHIVQVNGKPEEPISMEGESLPGWREPYEVRISRTVLREAGGEIPPAHSRRFSRSSPGAGFRVSQVASEMQARPPANIGVWVLLRMSRVMGVHSCARFATELAILCQRGGYCFSISQLGTFREE